MSDAPPFKLTRESRIRIDAQGRFWHEGERIEHQGLARGLACWIALDPATDRYILRNELDWCFITVDDTPLVVRTARVHPDGAVTLGLSDATEEPLDPGTLRIDAEGVPYCDVKGATLPAKFLPNAAFVLMEHLVEDGDGYALVLGGTRHAVKRVPAGEGAPRRAPTRPDD